MAELYIIGTVSGGSDFEETERLYCKWKCISDENNTNDGPHNFWRVLDGTEEGTTQQATMQFEQLLHWSHPIDIHYAFTSTVGWPRFYCEVWHVDEYNRHRLKGYGTCMIPTTPGVHTVECVTWRPFSGPDNKVFEGLLTTREEFADGPKILLEGDKRTQQWGETTGSVYLELNILLRGLAGKNLRL